MSTGLKVAVLGATGAVGGEFLRLFEQRNFPVSELRLLASARSAGKTADFQAESLPIHAVSADAFEGVDVAFFSAGASRSKEWASVANAAGAVVIDNSSAFRMDENVPLVVPEINGNAITETTKLVAVPNCTAIILCMALAPLRALGSIQRVIVSTYQSASGGGAAMMQYLLDDTKAYLDGEEGVEVRPEGLPPYAFNVFSHNTPILESGANEEEAKVMVESRKILGDESIRFNVTCVRVPVLRAHCESVTVEFADAAPTVEAVRDVLTDAAGIRLVDVREANRFPMPRLAGEQNDVLVGRIRPDVSNPNGLCMFIAGDQLLKGAALNAVQIAELMQDRGYLPS